MNIKVDMTPAMKQRMAAVAELTGLSEAQIITDALENGHSLDWQIRFARKVAEGAEAADRGEFASASDVDRVRNKYRQG